MSSNTLPFCALNSMQQLTSACPRGETRWFVDADLENTLLGPEGYRLREWQEADQLQIVKTGRHRTVYRLQLDADCFYLKHYRVSDWRALLQNVVRPPKAVLEWKAAQRVASVGVPTFETVAMGRTVARGFALDSYLATRAIDNTEQLETFVSHRFQQFAPRRQAVIRRHLAEEMGSLVATLHRGRLIHRDLHAENILIRVEDDERIRLWLIDLHAVSVCRRLTLRRIERNLALLNPFFAHYTTAIDRRRFFRAYWSALLAQPDSLTAPPGHLAHSTEQSTATDEQSKSIAKRMAAYSHKHNEQTTRKHDRKWALGNRRLIIADKKNICCRGLASLGSSSIIAIRDDPESAFADGNNHSLPDGSDRRRLTSLKLLCDGKTVDCTFEAVQRPRQSGWWRFGRRRYSAVRRAWEIGHAFLRRSITTAKPLMFVEIMSDETSTQYLLTETISAARSLHDFLRHDFHRLPEQRCIGFITDLARRLAIQLRKLHAEGFDHPTVSAETILVENKGLRPQLWFVSLENVDQRRRLFRRHVVASLASLNASLLQHDSVQMTHRLRFLKHYLKTRAPKQWRPLWQEIHRQTIRKLEADNRHPTDDTDSIAIVEHPLRRTA